MLDTRLSAFLNGILEFASDGSDWVGHSVLGVSAYTADGWKKAFRRHYHVRSFTPVETDETFSQAIGAWLEETPGELTQKVVSHVTYRLGQPLRVLRAADETKLLDDLSSCNGGIGAYWFTDGVFFVEFKTHMLAFLSGTFD